MKYERWLIPETDDAAVEALMDAGYPYLVSTVLASRGASTARLPAARPSPCSAITTWTASPPPAF